jgi:O-succinylhomoserine sulfhydrylase
MSNFETKAIRLQSRQTTEKEHSVPLFLTSSFTFDDAESGAALFANEMAGNIYSRFSNPNVDEFSNKMAALEQAESAVCTATGMSAVFTSLAAVLKKDDRIVASKSLFGNTLYILKNILPQWGIETKFVDLSDLSQWENAISEQSKMVLIETPANPTLEMADLTKLAEICKQHQIIFAVDNCFCTPYLQRPILHGADLVIHSATKWIDGQGRVLGGVIAGRSELVSLCDNFIRRTGPSLSAFNAWILSKSLETLAVRMDRHCQNALALAGHLEKHPKIERVIYPYLESHPQYDIARRQMSQGGGIVSIVLKDANAKKAAQFINALKLFSLTANLGDTRSIATHPATTTHSRLSSGERLEVGITDGLLRFSVGLENIGDIITDVEQALEKI